MKKIALSAVKDDLSKFLRIARRFLQQSTQLTAIRISLFLVIFAQASLGAASTDDSRKTIHHDLKVTIYPKEHRFAAEDLVTAPERLLPEFRFSLHRGLEPTSETPGVTLRFEKKTEGAVPLEYYKATLPAGLKAFKLRYGGIVHHPLDSGIEQARGFSQTPGIISDEGVYLGGSSFWYPIFDGGFITFSLNVELPAGWDAVSQGERSRHERNDKKTHVRWDSPEPQDEILLVAGGFTEYSRQAGRISAMAFLRKPDKELADKYLEATARYIGMYEKLIGPYPYKKFALVENFWETGFGMPSFTLLGPKVIRFPFILTSSYPHEILHNWWGNSVFPDYGKGNWSEGLTAYLADHLIKEQQGSGAEYRQTTLQKYADYVSKERDFPLTAFRSRHSPSSEAVGYGKSLMFFHMLRRSLGDAAFVEGLRDFYQRHKFRLASFDDLRKSFEKVSDKDLNTDFDQWVSRSGAPKLHLTDAKTVAEGDAYVLTALIEQVQPGEPYFLHVPVAVTLQGKERAYETEVVMEKKRFALRLRLPARPLRLDVDPGFDLFRRLDREEVPPAISQTLGAKKMLVLLPSSATASLLQAYRGFAKAISGAAAEEIEVRLDTEINKLPHDRAIIITGWENRFFDKALSALSDYEIKPGKKGLSLGKSKIPKENHSVVLSARNPGNKDTALTFIASGLADALPGLARKLPHYHKYSFLVFEGTEPENVIKGRWPVLASPMTAFLPGEDGAITRVEIGKLSPGKPLATLPPPFSTERMLETIRFLSSGELKGRGFGTPELDRAAEFIAEKFREAGLEPGGGEGSFFELWEDRGGEPERTTVLKNVIGVVRGTNSDRADQSVVIGAHYDHLGTGWPDVREDNKGKSHPGADDNASGVAVLIELAKAMAGTKPDRTIVFVAFTGEEAGRKGSRHYVATQERHPVEKTIGMLNLDTVGRLREKKLLALGAASAKEWPHIFRGVGFVTGVEIEPVSERLDSSDQVSFEEAGVPAVQLFTGPHPDYHRPTDTIDKIDAEGLVKVASIAKEVLEYLAGREGALTATIKTEKGDEQARNKERKTSLGTIPDFAFAGKGYRISGVRPGSPAETAGLREGDVIVRIDSVAVNSLKDLSNILKSLVPGKRISVTFIREGKEITVETTVTSK